MSKKLLTDLAGILAELEVTYAVAENLADGLEEQGLLDKYTYDGFMNTATNAPTGGECGCQ
jgi:hypothetical protein